MREGWNEAAGEELGIGIIKKMDGETHHPGFP
jgi:hypothetical protein